MGNELEPSAEKKKSRLAFKTSKKGKYSYKLWKQIIKKKNEKTNLNLRFIRFDSQIIIRVEQVNNRKMKNENYK